MGAYEDLLGLGARGAGRATEVAAEGGFTAAGRIAHKLGNPDEGDYFQWAFGFIPTGNLGTALGVHDPVVRFALDAALDPFQAVNLIPYSFVTKIGRAGEVGRYLKTAERLDAARQVVQARGLMRDAGRGLEFLDTVRRGDDVAIRGFKDLLEEADDATLAFFRGEQGRAIKAYLSDPSIPRLEIGLSKQVRAGQRAAYGLRTPFGFRTLLGDHELVLLRGPAFAENVLEKVPHVGKWLQRLGEGKVRGIIAGISKADAAVEAHHAVEGLQAPARELGDQSPVFRPLQQQARELAEATRPLYSEYMAARTANRVKHLDTKTLLDWADRAEDGLRADLAVGRGDAALAADIAQTSAVAGGSDISDNFVPFLQRKRQTYANIRNLVPPEYRRVLSELDERLARAIEDPARAREAVGPEAIREMLGTRREILGGLEAGLREGRIPGSEELLKAGESDLAKTAAREEARVALPETADAAKRLEAAKAKLAQVELDRAAAIARADLRPGEAAEMRLKTRLNVLDPKRAELQQEVARLRREAAGQAENLSARAAEKAAVGQAREVPAETLERLERLAPAAEKLKSRQDFISRLEAALPAVGAREGSATERLVGASEAFAKQVETAAAKLPELAAELRKLSGRAKLAAEPQVQAIVRHVAEAAGAIGVMSEGRGQALRDAIEKAWPELGAEIKDLHRSWEAPTHVRALEQDLLAAWNPAVSKDAGGQGRGLRNLYGAAPSPNSLAEDYFAYKGQTTYRAAQYIAQQGDAWDKLARDPVKSLDFMRAFKYSGAERRAFLDTLDDREAGLFHSVERLLIGAEAIGHGRWYEHAVAGYFPIVTRPGKKGVEAYQLALKNLGVRFRSGVESRHFRPRLSETLDAALELEKQGVLTVEKDPRKILSGYLDALTRVSANQRLYDIMGRSRGLDGLPILMRVKDMARVSEGLGYDRSIASRYLQVDGLKFPALAGTMIHRDHADVLKVFGPQTISEVIRQDSPFWQAIQRLNLGIKGGVLSLSFFHAVAQAATIAAYTGLRKATNFLTSAERFGRESGLPTARLANFVDLHRQSGELVEHAIRHGLELDSWDRAAADAFKSFGARVVEAMDQSPTFGPGGPMRVLVSPITGLKHFNDFTHKVTWEYIHNSGKVFLYSEFLQRLMKERPGIPFELAAKEAAGTANRALGGLAWQKMFGDATFRARMQVFMLAPDWTLANLAQARDFFVGAYGKTLRPDEFGRYALPVRDLASPTGAGLLARRFWLNWGMAAFGTMQALNLAFTGRFTWQNPGDKANLFKVDLGRKDSDGKPVFLSFGKQFLEPFELAMDPIKYLRGKAAPFPSTVAALLQQEDRFGRPISTPSDSTSRKVRGNLGWLLKSAAPIPFQGVAEATRAYARGDVSDGNRTLLNAGTSMFDVQIRPQALPRGAQEANTVAPAEDLDDDLPRSLPRHLLPPIQRRFVFMRDRR